MAVSKRTGGPKRDHEDPEVGWKDRVTFADFGRGPFAYRPTDVLVTEKGLDEARRIARERWPNHALPRPDQVGVTVRLRNVQDPLVLVAELRMRGIVAEPNYVLFTHCGCCGPHPATAAYGAFTINPATINPATINPATINPATINPATINPATINPATINPATINPATINPARINPNHPARVTGLRRSSALPAAPTKQEVKAMTARIQATARRGAPSVVVLDTGLPLPDPETEPPVIKAAPAIHAAKPAAKIDEPDNDGNDHLDPAAGHGTFIAGIINQVAPGCTVTVDKVASMYGDTDQFTAAKMISELKTDARTILNLSFGGHVMDDEALTLAWAIRKFQAGEGVVVASAGNDSTCLPSFPAALPGVISVGAIGPSGAALFTNYGPWVRACAPGVDLTSAFFNFKGKRQPGGEGTDPDDFAEWARWSGTSFSAPVVVGALGRMMMWSGCTAAEAVERVIDAPELMRIPGLGTVVNVI